MAKLGIGCRRQLSDNKNARVLMLLCEACLIAAGEDPTTMPNAEAMGKAAKEWEESQQRLQ